MRPLEPSLAEGIQSAVSENDDPSFLSLLRYACAHVPLESLNLPLTLTPVDLSAPVPERIGRFIVEEVIGEGGFGIVLRVYDPNLERSRALKVPNLRTLSSPTSLSSFLDEAKKAARIDHPNVVRVFDAAELGPLCYILMEFCPEGSLADWLAKRPADSPVPVRWAVGLLAEVADGVHQAHVAGVLHRDLKPGNVLLVRAGEDTDDDLPHFRPKVGDFGLAKALPSHINGAVEPSDDARAGTLAYMAPEQVRGEAEIRASADVYALGAILYEMFTSQRLYPGLRKSELVNRISSHEPSPSPRTLRPDLPRELDRVCQTCLAKSASQRYATAAELAADLRRYLNEGWVRGSSPWKRAQAYLAKHRGRVAATVLGVALTAAVGFAVWQDKLTTDAKSWLDRLEASSSNISALPTLLAEHNPRDPRVAGRIEELFHTGNPAKKLVAAVALADSHSDAAEFAYAALLDAPPDQVRALASALRDRMPRLIERLERSTESLPTKSTAPAPDDTRPRQRANAATALIHLGQGSRAWEVLRFEPNPEARSIFIHELGPAGIPPHVIFDRLKVEPDVSTRRALILAAGEVPDSEWDRSLRIQAEQWLLEHYEHDLDAGVHGATKWLLGRWQLTPAMRQADARLKSSRPDAASGWRIGTPLELTLIRFEDPETGRVIEVADTESTVAQVLTWKRVPYRESASPGPDYPINGATYLVAAEFFNWLSKRDRVADDQLAYRPGASDKEPSLVPVEGQLDRVGYRLLTDREFEVACRAGTRTARYHGSSATLLARYAWYGPPVQIRSNLVGRLKPNDLGLFDMLGNVSEICQLSSGNNDPWTQAVACGGSVLHTEHNIRSDSRSARTHVAYSLGSNDCGFRVARTVRPRGTNRPSGVR